MIEAFEEAGVRDRIIGHGRARTYSYIKEQPAALEIKLRVGVFLMAVEKVLDDWPERPARERLWFDPAEAAGLVAEPRLAQLIGQLPQTVCLTRTRWARQTPGERGMCGAAIGLPRDAGGGLLSGMARAAVGAFATATARNALARQFGRDWPAGCTRGCGAIGSAGLCCGG